MKTAGAEKARVVVIGAGPGGYPAAIKAAQLGAEVVLVERGGLGGTCLQRGCIPTKFLLRAAKEYRHLAEAARRIEGMPALPPVDLAALRRQKNELVNRIAGQTAALLRGYGIRTVLGTAEFKDPRTIRICETGAELNATAFIIASGSESVRPPIEGIDLQGVLDSDQILELGALPESLIVIGGGYIGLEFAQIFHLLGSRVVVLEQLPQVLPTEDAEVAAGLVQIMTRSGITIRTGTRVKAIRRAGDGLEVMLDGAGGPAMLRAEKVLVAVGRRPCVAPPLTAALGLELTENRAIRVDARNQTALPGIFAVGDAAGGPMLAHKATAEGEAAARHALGIPCASALGVIPNVIYTLPEAARAGLTEAEARARYGQVRIGRFPFAANGRALIEEAAEGFVKIIAEPEYERIVGVSVLGLDAGHLIAEAALAIQMEAAVEDIAETVHAHPTLAEALREAALDCQGAALHLPPRRARRLGSLA